MNQLDRAMQTIVHCLLAMKKLEMENTALQEENAKLRTQNAHFKGLNKVLQTNNEKDTTTPSILLNCLHNRIYELEQENAKLLALIKYKGFGRRENLGRMIELESKLTAIREIME